MRPPPSIQDASISPKGGRIRGSPLYIKDSDRGREGGREGYLLISRVCLSEMDPEEKEHLLKEIQNLKEEIASMRSSSLLGDQQPKDIVRKC